MSVRRILSIAVLFIWTLGSALGQASVTSAAREYRQANEHQLLREFVEMLAIPNVASDTPNIHKNVEYLVGLMNQRGLKPRVLTAADKNAPPVVYGESVVPGAKQTLIILLTMTGSRPTQSSGPAVSRRCVRLRPKKTNEFSVLSVASVVKGSYLRSANLYMPVASRSAKSSSTSSWFALPDSQR